MKSPIKNKIFKQKTITPVAIALCVIFCFGYTNDSMALEGDELIVIESLVNVRSGPDGEAEPLFRLAEGRKVIEIQRQNNWIEVDAQRDDHATGWIHKTLLSKIGVSENTSSPTRFDKFLQRFNEQNEIIKNQNGTLYFTEAADKGEGKIELIATQDWINGDMEMHNETLSVIFKIWSDVTPVGKSIAVQVVDEQGQRYTVMMR